MNYFNKFILVPNPLMTLEIPEQYQDQSVIVVTSDFTTFGFKFYKSFRFVYWVCCMQFGAFLTGEACSRNTVVCVVVCV